MRVALLTSAHDEVHGEQVVVPTRAVYGRIPSLVAPRHVTVTVHDQALIG